MLHSRLVPQTPRSMVPSAPDYLDGLAAGWSVCVQPGRRLGINALPTGEAKPGNTALKFKTREHWYRTADPWRNQTRETEAFHRSSAMTLNVPGLEGWGW